MYCYDQFTTIHVPFPGTAYHDFAPDAEGNYLPTSPSFWAVGDRALGWLLVAAPANVPEPSTLLLLGSGLVGLAGFGRKKFKK